jgi:hypothetical protein
LFAIFGMKWHGDNIRKCHYITHFLYGSLFCCRPRITKQKNADWWQCNHWTQSKRTNQTRLFGQFRCYAIPWHYQGEVPWPFNCSATTSLKTPIFTPSGKVHKSLNSDAPGKK